MSNAIPYKYFPLVYGVCIALDCLFMPLLLRRQSVNGTLHGRNQLIAIDVVLDLVGGCLLPFFCFGPMVLALVENPPMLRRSDWSIQALSISEFVLIHSLLDFIMTLLPFLLVTMLLNDLQLNIRRERAPEITRPSRTAALKSASRAFSTAMVQHEAKRQSAWRWGTRLSMVWGLVVLGLAIRAPMTLDCAQPRVASTCSLKVWPWLGRSDRCHCFVYGVFCKTNPALTHMNEKNMTALLESLVLHEDPTTPKALRINDCPVTHLPPALAQWTNLVMLRVKRSQLKDVSTFPFRALTSLMLVDFEESQLTIPPLALPPTCSFVLLFTAPHLHELPPSIEQDWAHVVWLALRRAPIAQFPMKVLTLPNLIHLSLTGCHGITTLPSNITALTRLKELELADTNVARLPSTMASMTGLYRVTLSGTKIATLEDLPWSRARIEGWNTDGQNKTLLTLTESPVCHTDLAGTDPCAPQCAVQCDRSFQHDLICQRECNETACSYDGGQCLDYTNGALYN